MENVEPQLLERTYTIGIVRTKHFPYISLTSRLVSYLAAPPGGVDRIDPPPIYHHPRAFSHSPAAPLASTAASLPSMNAVTNVTAFWYRVMSRLHLTPHPH